MVDVVHACGVKDPPGGHVGGRSAVTPGRPQVAHHVDELFGAVVAVCVRGLGLVPVECCLVAVLACHDVPPEPAAG